MEPPTRAAPSTERNEALERRRRRAGACLACRGRKAKCPGPGPRGVCANCAERALRCEFVPRKRQNAVVGPAGLAVGGAVASIGAVVNPSAGFPPFAEFPDLPLELFNALFACVALLPEHPRPALAQPRLALSSHPLAVAAYLLRRLVVFHRSDFYRRHKNRVSVVDKRAAIGSFAPGTAVVPADGRVSNDDQSHHVAVDARSCLSSIRSSASLSTIPLVSVLIPYSLVHTARFHITTLHFIPPSYPLHEETERDARACLDMMATSGWKQVEGAQARLEGLG